MPARAGLLHKAVRLEWFTVGWNAVEAGVAILAGWMAGSIALVGFGLDSVIESLSGLVLLGRLSWERREMDRPGGVEACALERREKRAMRIVGLTFFLLSGYVAYEAVRKLWVREVPEVTWTGLVLLLLSLAIMPALAASKIRVSRGLASGALRADAGQTIVCSVLSAITLAGLGLNAAFGWWWADPAAALAILPWLLVEGVRAWTGKSCC
jgi:divalent metal cation (Fe/Co/Zn/Cd) transporter